MLGLGNSVISGSSITPIFTYSSDFTSSTDNWSKAQGTGNITMLHNQNPNDINGAYPDEDGWLVASYDTTQTAISGIHHIFTPGYTQLATDRATISYRIILASFDPSTNINDWGLDDVTTRNRVGKHASVGDGISIPDGGDLQVEIPVNQVFSYQSDLTGIINQSSYDAIALFWLATGDLPKATARIYLKDVDVNFYR